MTVDKKLERRNQDLQRINDNLERWHRVLTRAVNKINKLRKARDALLRPRKLKDFEIESLTGEQWHSIRNQHREARLNDSLADI